MDCSSVHTCMYITVHHYELLITTIGYRTQSVKEGVTQFTDFSYLFLFHCSVLRIWVMNNALLYKPLKVYHEVTMSKFN